MRTFTIIAYFIIEVIYVSLMPPVFLIFFILIPLRFILKKNEATNKIEKDKIVDDFLAKRMLDGKNKENVLKWFDYYYENVFFQKPWYEKESLFSMPPLARDWHVGYTPTLNQFGVEVNDDYVSFRNLIDRENEIKKIEQILSKANGANAILVGDEGVGRFTIIAGLTKKIFEGKVNSLLSYKRVFKIDIEKILAQSTDTHQKEEILKNIFEEAKDAGNLILYIDNIERYLTSDFGKMDLTHIIEEYAQSPKLHLISVTTPFFYQKFIYPSQKISQLFEKVDVAEVSKDQAMEILLETIFDLEKQYKMITTYEAIKEAIDKSEYYITNIPFPEKAIDLIHDAASYLCQNPSDQKLFLVPDVIDTVLAEKTHVPVNLTVDFKKKLIDLESILKNRVISQEKALGRVVRVLQKAFVEMGSRKKPTASFLFLGKTGVGKTETAKALSQAFFSSENQIIRIDMSFYQDKDDIEKLLGSQSTNNPGILTTEIRQKPYAVLLIDEIEKADINILNIFLTALDEGYLIDGWGKKIDLKNQIIIATSNAASDFLMTNEIGDNDLINLLVDKKYFTPEFLNRFDGVIIFEPLNSEAIKIIAKKIIDKIVGDQKNKRQISINVSDAFINELIAKGYDPKFGARNIERVISEEIESKIAKLILENKIIPNEIVNF
jgi:ATP-dependent Clp protease ATP-binding subunit ClpC